MDSLPLLIAGARPSGALIAIDGAQAREVIRRRPEAGLIRDFGQVAFTPEFSPNGSFLRVQTGSEDWLITDGAREIALPPLEVLPSFSPRDAKIAFSVTEGAFVVNLVDGRASRVGDAAQDVSFSADGSMLVLHISGQPARVVDIGTGAVRTVAASETPPAISPDGMWLAGWRSAMDAYAMNLETGATWRLGRFSSERTAFVFSPDSRFLATVGPNDIWQLMDLRTGREIRIGGFEGFGPRFTANSRWLVGIASPDRVFVLDLVSGQRHSFGVAVDIEPAPDGETIALMTGDDSRIVSLATRQARTLGHSLHSISFSADVTRLMALDASDNAYVYDLATGAVVRELGQTYAYPAFTVDGRRVAARTMDGVTYVVDLESGTRADLGFSMDTRSNGAELSSDGRLLAMWDRAGDGFVFDLDRIFAKLNRGVTVSDLCSGDAGALTRSFPPEIRGDENVAADADAARHRSALHRQLRGRPWNPCDWRGLGAILPDTERGGGWFEGLRQWWRLHLVRTGLAVDYACGEVNAAGATDPARLRGCAITPPSI